MSEGSAQECRVFAVVVAFQPDPALISRIVRALEDQVAVTLVIDNANGDGLEELIWRDRLERIDMKGNAGVGAAQNAGIRHAREHGATHILLLDHDSLPGIDMTERLVAASRRLRAQGERVAAVGADYRDVRHPDSSPFVVMRRWGFGRVKSEMSDDPVPVPFLISAGTLISTEALADVGPMDERLFIDYVDVEWCLRARGKGWTCHGVPGAMLDHRLGDEVLEWGNSTRPVRVFGRTFPSRSSLRHYYMFRNGCWLIVHGSMPYRWKILEAKRLLACFCAFALFASHRGQQIRAMSRGMLHGVQGILGPA